MANQNRWAIDVHQSISVGRLFSGDVFGVRLCGMRWRALAEMAYGRWSDRCGYLSLRGIQLIEMAGNPGSGEFESVNDVRWRLSCLIISGHASQHRIQHFVSLLYGVASINKVFEGRS